MLLDGREWPDPVSSLTDGPSRRKNGVFCPSLMQSEVTKWGAWRTVKSGKPAEKATRGPAEANSNIVIPTWSGSSKGPRAPRVRGPGRGRLATGAPGHGRSQAHWWVRRRGITGHGEAANDVHCLGPAGTLREKREKSSNGTNEKSPVGTAASPNRGMVMTRRVVVGLRRGDRSHPAKDTGRGAIWPGRPSPRGCSSFIPLGRSPPFGQQIAACMTPVIPRNRQL